MRSELTCKICGSAKKEVGLEDHTLPCGHQFHLRCIFMYNFIESINNCPVCLKKIQPRATGLLLQHHTAQEVRLVRKGLSALHYA